MRVMHEEDPIAGERAAEVEPGFNAQADVEAEITDAPQDNPGCDAAFSLLDEAKSPKATTDLVVDVVDLVVLPSSGGGGSGRSGGGGGGSGGSSEGLESRRRVASRKADSTNGKGTACCSSLRASAWSSGLGRKGVSGRSR
jgi:hypothetical protein